MPPDGVPASPGTETTPPAVPGSDPSPPAPKSDIERLRESKDEWKAKAQAAEAEAARLKAEKKAEEDRKLAEEKRFEELAAANAAEAAREKARADAAEAKAAAYEATQEAELVEILKGISDDKKPPLDPSDPVSKRLQQAKYAASLLAKKPDDPIGGPPRAGGTGSKADRLKELLRKPNRTPEERAELAAMS